MSYRTTNLGPVVSLSTVLADQTPPHLYLDSNTSLTVEGSFTIPGLGSGFAAAVSGNTASLSFSTGGVTYTFTSDTSA